MKQSCFILLGLLLSTLIFFSSFPNSALCVHPQFDDCVPKSCGHGPNISYPFWLPRQPLHCGHPSFNLTCGKDGYPVLQMPQADYRVLRINNLTQTVLLVDERLVGSRCPPFSAWNLSLFRTPFRESQNQFRLTLRFNCSVPTEKFVYYPIHCEGVNDAFASVRVDGDSRFLGAAPDCNTTVDVPIDGNRLDLVQKMLSGYKYKALWQKGFSLTWTASNCSACATSGGKCGFDWDVSRFTCFCPDRPHKVSCKNEAGKNDAGKSKRKKIIIGVSVGVGSFFLAWVIFYSRQFYQRKRLAASSMLLSRDDPADASSKHDLEKWPSIHYATHMFSYKELREATNNFDSDRELGDGGFGAVYLGKLRDGRTVAVKRLYDHHYRRMELFLNEVKILSGLRHQSLVSLYGCTSRHSRELLLVYEYVPNGTVADHLHGDLAQDAPLTWPIRMSIAIETAEALAYLHAVEPPIIHRDVKTNNILLDANFRVKVADFGLSRLFPADATHVSTIPQGTPGYVDPEYHKSYQLTDKSDVYSYGVVLMELISSMPAVDIGRHHHDVKLATLAVNKIVNRALDELVDPNLGYGSDSSVTRMVKLMAELGFRCLQEEKDMRPSMEEVVFELKSMEGGNGVTEKEVMEGLELGNEPDDARLLKTAPPHSPVSVAEKWISSDYTTPNTSG